MLSMHLWSRVKQLKLEGAGIKSIARKLKISKNTVKKYLKDPNPPEFRHRDYQSAVFKYDNEVKNMLSERFIGTRIYSEIQKLGFRGSLSAVHKYVKKIKADASISEKRTTRFETDPGYQMQYDWTVWPLLFIVI